MDGREAIELIAKYKDEFVIVLLDLIMPDVDGFGVLEYMKEQDYLSTIPVVLITVDEEQSNAKKSYEYGVADIIRKPFNREIVMRRVKNIIDLYSSKHHLEVWNRVLILRELSIIRRFC